jgi:GWxTD domain-containing protein
MRRIAESQVTRRLKRTLFLVASVLLCASFSLVHPATSGGVERLYLSVDFASFRGDSSRSFLEVYYSYGAGQLRYLKDDDKFISTARFDLRILEPQTRAVVFQKIWKVPHTVPDTAALEVNRSLVGVLGAWVKPDHYLLRLTGVDMNDENNCDSLEMPIALKQFPADSLSLSDIELCTSIKQTERNPALWEFMEATRRGIAIGKIPVGNPNSFFVKNTLEVIPNPSVLYGIVLPVMYYYIEVYNLMTKMNDGEYSYTVEVLDAAGHEVIGHNHTKKRVHDSSVEVGAIDLGKLKTGTYTLQFSLDDSMTQQQTASSKKFFVYNPGVIDSTAKGGRGIGDEYLMSEYALMDEKAIDKEFEVVRYLALGDEMKHYQSLTELDAKRKFMYEFWKRRDPDPATLENEAKKEYMERVEYANSNFHSGMKEGWKTDRGRVYIVYGPPDEVERHPNEIGSKPYEIWLYHNIQGGVEFDFIDRSGFSDYVLVNSTHHGEIRDDNWQQQLNVQ